MWCEEIGIAFESQAIFGQASVCENRPAKAQPLPDGSLIRRRVFPGKNCLLFLPLAWASFFTGAAFASTRAGFISLLVFVAATGLFLFGLITAAGLFVFGFITATAIALFGVIFDYGFVRGDGIAAGLGVKERANKHQS